LPIPQDKDIRSTLAFKPTIAPTIYFLPMGRQWQFDRVGDICCGIFAKKPCDHLGRPPS
jgi:hypothetical protein